MIRVSDSAEKLIKAWAEEKGITITASVDSILAAFKVAMEGGEKVARAGACGVLQEYLDKRLDKIEALIADTAVDRLATGSTGGGRAPGGKEWVPWDQMSYIIFTHDDDDPAWIIPEASVFQFKNGDPTAYAYFIKDNVIFMESVGRPEPLIKVTPEIREAIDKHFTYAD